MPSRSSRSRPASFTSFSEPSGSASRTAMRMHSRLDDGLHFIQPSRIAVVDSAFDADQFEIEQLIRPMVNLYRISARGMPVAFVRQKRMALKEDIRFFKDENESEEL